MKKKWIRQGAAIFCAGVITMALALDIAPARPIRPEASDLFGYAYQLIARTFASMNGDRLAGALLMAACVWLCRRFLFEKPRGTGAGEYALCAFFSVMTLFSKAARAQDTVRVLWENAFQLCKAALILTGMFLLFLTLTRALRHGLLQGRRDGLHSLPVSLQRLADGSFWRPFLFIAAAWLPQIIIRYPGVLMWDSYMQIKQFMGEAERLSSHPPFGTLVYGALAWLGEAARNRNLVYFLFTLVQCACYIAVLSYSLTVIKRLGAPGWIRLAALVAYAFSPCYAGWATVIAKDTMFQIALLMLVALTLVFLGDRERFFNGWKHPALLGTSFLVMALSRHNGLPLAGAALAAMLIALPPARANGRAIIKLLSCGLAGIALAVGAEAAISSALGIQDRYMQDVMSLPFQQTARVVKLHGGEVPDGEAALIDRVLDYDALAENYDDWYADAVKDTYRQTATRRDRMAYWGVWWKQLCRWPADYLDAALHMNGALMDLSDNVPMYISFSDMAQDDYVYPWSFNDMDMYDREALAPLNSIQRALTEWYMRFDQLPLVGLLASMSFNVLLMLSALYISVTQRRGSVVLTWLPALMTLAACLFAPVVYLRYALPIIGSVPMGLAAFYVETKKKPAA